jgi:hypothetical protein
MIRRVIASQYGLKSGGKVFLMDQRINPLAYKLCLGFTGNLTERRADESEAVFEIDLDDKVGLVLDQ